MLWSMMVRCCSWVYSLSISVLILIVRGTHFFHLFSLRYASQFLQAMTFKPGGSGGEASPSFFFLLSGSVSGWYPSGMSFRNASASGSLILLPFPQRVSAAALACLCFLVCRSCSMASRRLTRWPGADATGSNFSSKVCQISAHSCGSGMPHILASRTGLSGTEPLAH